MGQITKMKCDKLNINHTEIEIKKYYVIYASEFWYFFNILHCKAKKLHRFISALTSANLLILT